MADITTEADFTRLEYLNTNPEVVAQRKAYLRSLWHAVAPEIELQYGVINSIVSGPAAMFSQAVIDSLEICRRHTQIQALMEDTNANPEINSPHFDAFLDNYRVKRKTGNYSTGKVRLTFSDNSTYAFGPANTFTARGVDFHPTATYTYIPAGRGVYAQYTYELQRLDDGTYVAEIELQSTTISIDGNLPVGTKLYAVESYYGSLIDIEVIESFTGGIAEDTLSTLMPKLVEGITAPVLTSRANIAAQLKSIPEFNIQEVSVIGVGDQESIRDRHGLFNISQGGRGDIYVRTNGTLLNTTIKKDCKLARTINANTAIYHLYLTKDDMPAAYGITKIKHPEDVTSLKIISEQRSVDLTEEQFAPDIINYIEGAFSAYQTILIEFEDDNIKRYGEDGPPKLASYDISYDYLPNIVDIQKYCSNRNNISVMGDILVKAAIPCKTTISFSVGTQPGQIELAKDTLKNTIISAVVNTVSSTGFMNVLPSSIIIEAVQRLLPVGMFVSDFNMVGELVLPVIQQNEGSINILRSTSSSAKEELRFEILPYATVNTICFFTDAESVLVNFKACKSVSKLLN
jgi:hypothetical protein